MEQWSLEMKYKLLILLILIFGGHCFNLYRQSDVALPEVETFEIKDKVTGNTHIFSKEPKLKKNMLYCQKDNEKKVIWVDWHPDQTPEFTYRVDSYENYINRTWVEQHYGYRIAP